MTLFDHMTEPEPDWREAADHAIDHVARTFTQFTVDDVWNELHDRAPGTVARSAMGPRMLAAAKAGVIHKTGARRPSQSGRSNRMVPVWAAGEAPRNELVWLQQQLDQLERVCWVTGCDRVCATSRGLRRHLQVAHGLDVTADLVTRFVPAAELQRMLGSVVATHIVSVRVDTASGARYLLTAFRE